MTDHRILLMYVPSTSHLVALQTVAPETEFVWATSEAEARHLIEDAEAVLGNRYFLQSLPAARRLRWMQSNSVGMDLVLSQPQLTQAITITNARGVYDEEMADHALALLLALTRGIHRARDRQVSRIWQRESLCSLSHSTALILGWGGVGRAVARRLCAFGVNVRAARRQHQGDPALEGDVLICGQAQWRDLLPSTDWLFIALPLTPETRGLIGISEMRELRPGSIVINVARGAIIQEVALFELLREGHLSGAGLDVLEDEPPSPDHPVYATPNVLLTPHVARSLERGSPRWENLFVENVRRFTHDLPLLNVVDKVEGY